MLHGEMYFPADLSASLLKMTVRPTNVCCLVSRLPTLTPYPPPTVTDFSHFPMESL